MVRYINHSQILWTEERYDHEACGDTRSRLYVKRIPKGWLLHCHNCGWSGFHAVDSNNLSDLKERLKHASKGVTKDSESEHTCLSLPSDFRGELPALGIMWLNQYNVDSLTAHKYHMGYSEKLNRLILPLYDREGELIFWQGRSLTKPYTKQNPKYLNIRGPKNKYAVMSEQDGLQTVCLVEDILSAIRVSNNGVDAIPLLGSHISNWLLNYLKPYGTILVWLDLDKRFESLRFSQRIRLLTGIKCHSVVTKLDPKEYGDEDIRNWLKI